MPPTDSLAVCCLKLHVLQCHSAENTVGTYLDALATLGSNAVSTYVCNKLAFLPMNAEICGDQLMATCSEYRGGHSACIAFRPEPLVAVRDRKKNRKIDRKTQKSPSEIVWNMLF